MSYLNSVLLEGYVESMDYANENDEAETLLSATLYLTSPRIPIDVTDLMKADPSLDPILMQEVRIVGRIVDDGEYPYIKADHLERRLPR